MQIEIIGADPAVAKAVQAKLASRGFASTVAAPSTTPLPWRYCRISNLGDYAITGPKYDGTNDIVRGSIGDGAFSVENTRLIVASVNAMPELLAERDRLAASNAELLAALSGMVAEVDSGARVRGPAVESARAAIANAERSAK